MTQREVVFSWSLAATLAAEDMGLDHGSAVIDFGRHFDRVLGGRRADGQILGLKCDLRRASEDVWQPSLPS